MLSEVVGKGGISAKVVAYSRNVCGVGAGGEITTFELTYPRMIHSEFMTHRLFSRNAASSRAIPVDKMIGSILENMAMPIHWGKNQPGMQAKEENDQKVVLGMFHSTDEGQTYQPVNGELSRERAWEYVGAMACQAAECFNEAGYHKQIVNRITEPYQFIRVVVTSTEWDNFFALRLHPDAQPEIQELARCMWEAKDLSDPVDLSPGDWHLPYFQGGFWTPCDSLCLKDAIAISASCCAQVSFRTSDDSLSKAKKIYAQLVENKPVHASPFEHQATPMKAYKEIEDSEYNTVGLINSANHPSGWENGVTHADRNGNLWSGNFKGWIQNRQLIKDHTVWEYKHADSC